MTVEMQNNFYMTDAINTQCPHIVAILQGHPLYESLTKTVLVPERYLYQLWDSIEYIPETDSTIDHFKFKLVSDGFSYRFRFDLAYFRTTVGFPESDFVPNKENFDDIPDDATLIKSINELGYERPFTTVKDFKRKFLSRQWCTLYSILNRCLSPSNTGMDSITKPTMKILYGVAYHRHIDYASLIWEQMIKLVKGKHRQQRRYVPFIRFFAIIIDQYLQGHEEIPKLHGEQIVFLHAMKTVQANTGSLAVNPRPIPDSLLQLADQNDPSIVAYRELVAPMEPLQPQGPAKGAHREPGLGSSQRGSIRKESEVKRTEDVRIVVDSASERRIKLRHYRPVPSTPSYPVPEPTQPSTHHSSPEIQILAPTDIPRPPKAKRQKSVVRRHPKSIKRQRSLESTDKEETPPTSSANQDVSSSRNVESDPAVISTPESQPITDSGNDDSAHAFSNATFDYGAFDDKIGVQGGFEGVVEKINVSERSGREKGSKEKVDPPQTSPECRVNMSTTETHVLHLGIKEAGSYPLSHAQSPPSYSDSSQQESVSIFHGDYPRLLSPSHSETRDIEIRSTLPELLPSIFARASSTNLRALILESSHFRSVAGTNIETTFYVASRGLLGNPASANIMPTLNAGLTTHVREVPIYERFGDSGFAPLHTDVVGITDRLSDTGYEFTPFLAPEFQHIVDRMARQRVSSPSPETQTPTPIMTTSSSSLIIHPQQLSQSTQTSTTSQFSPSSQSSHSYELSQFYNLSLSDIQTIFHAKLLSTSNLSPIENAILSLLNSSTQSSSALDLSTVLARLDNFASQFESINKRLTFLEQSCRPSSLSFSSHHDDADSEDQHEVENRGKGLSDLSGAHSQEQSAGQSTQAGGIGTSGGSSGGASDDVDSDNDFFDFQPLV